MNAYQAIQLNTFERTLIDLTNALYNNSAFDAISKEELRDILSSGQVMSKKWLIQEFSKIYSQHYKSGIKAVVCGGWVGFLTQALINLDENIFADTLDISEKSIEAAKVVTHSSGRSSAICSDMYNFDYSGYSCIVNTSAEHIPDLKGWVSKLPKGILVVVQSNNARHITEHISCVDSPEELESILSLSEVFYSGELKFPMYTRYMVIGKT